jgi:hypothetical protein
MASIKAKTAQEILMAIFRLWSPTPNGCSNTPRRWPGDQADELRSRSTTACCAPAKPCN